MTWKKGESGNPKGGPKSPVTEAYVETMNALWQRQGDACLERILDEQPWTFFWLMNRLVPKKLLLEQDMVTTIMRWAVQQELLEQADVVQSPERTPPSRTQPLPRGR